MRATLFIAVVAFSAIIKASPINHEGAYAEIAAAMGLQDLTEAEVLASCSKTSPGVFTFTPADGDEPEQM
ncbi:hypothetical protein BJ138DRAFT_1115727 [Hygrophoropsis aurantiaca]|uniref:Uncharacterized protein n=1 Tax=Hygrophoropsis aurantiaca TaxID=72124 RepID=A0ACB8A531_9AGAM|nr:hypothetical protein BJ138DRAFT_1115727 [Hygrophoropsis aurantiaca]